ncbi:DUF2971 domain-containing protein [Shewanella cyperi]|uniref:DUF2971 domain-containing protein n=1 Tax=Shewanella cyperi TaxID=2814292 RepID=A0A975ALW2_9GAMM|nr:DUF2971 domain-containing protein [Shewanella cyperi]QSX30633.1 DUF2971 domain-containing protein [Shewanella cyperi]
MDFPTDRIYKFSPFNENSISALANSAVWFSKLTKLNDPFEGFVTYDEPKDEDEKVTKLIKLGAEFLREKTSPKKAIEIATQRYLADGDLFINKVNESVCELKAQREAFFDSLCVFSTSVDIPDYQYPNYANMLMWSHYGNGFSGFCLQFSASKFYRSLKVENPKVAWSTVEYVSEPKSFSILDYLNQDSIEYCRPILTKHEQWSYEGELRFISNIEGLHHYSNEALEVIYIGEKMPIGQQQVIIAIANNYYPNAKVLKVSIHPSGYNVITEKI